MGAGVCPVNTLGAVLCPRGYPGTGGSGPVRGAGSRQIPPLPSRRPGGFAGSAPGSNGVSCSALPAPALPGQGMIRGACRAMGAPGLGSAVYPAMPAPANCWDPACILPFKCRCYPYIGLLAMGTATSPLPRGFVRCRGPGHGASGERLSRSGEQRPRRGGRCSPAARRSYQELDTRAVRHSLPRDAALGRPGGNGDGHGYLLAEGTWAGGVNHACLPLTHLPGRYNSSR